MDRNNAKVIHTENRYQRWIRETKDIRKHAQRTVKQDEGTYMLSHTWNAVLKEQLDSRGHGRPVKSDGATTPPEQQLSHSNIR